MKPLRDLSIAQRLAAMFALAALLVFTLVGVTLYKVLETQIVRYQRAELETKLRYVAGSVAVCDMRDRWYKVKDKVESLTSSDRSTKIWAWSDDSGFRIGQSTPKVEAAKKRDRGMGRLWLSDSNAPYRTLEEVIRRAASGRRFGCGSVSTRGPTPPRCVPSPGRWSRSAWSAPPWSPCLAIGLRWSACGRCSACPARRRG